MREVRKITRALRVLAATAVILSALPPATADEQSQGLTALPSHVLPALQHAVAVSGSDSAAPLTITIVLKRDDEAGFQQFLHDVYDPASPNFRHFLTPLQIADRFGPSRQSYLQVADFLRAQGLGPALGSVNRLTLTVDAARADVERAFGVHIGDYALGKRTFFANREAPTLPIAVAGHVDAVLGLSNLAQATRPSGLTQGQPKPDDDPFLADTCKLSSQLDGAEERIGYVEKLTGVEFKGSAALSFATTVLHYQCAADELNLVAAYAANAGGAASPAPGLESPGSALASGAGQTIGLAEFDSYNASDVLGFLNLVGYPQRMSQLSNTVIGAGPNFTVQGESEVLLDIDTTLSLAPGANVVTYEAGFRGQGSFQTMFNVMIGAGVDVISNSWAYCEDQTTLADVQSLDAILQSAQASGITVLTGAGDSGSTCLDGAPNTIAVPADSPNITAVGGTTALPGLDGTYGSETWWDGSQHTPPSGQGGFGNSRFFARPAYQNGLNAQAQRSIPDVSAPADPAQGVLICQADGGGCPSNFLYGGTSIAAPIWASAVAVLNQRVGSNLGFLNPQIYPLASDSAFHSAASMGSDFAHVGLGSPNFSELKRLLTGGTADAPSLSNSAVVAFPPQVFADGSSVAGVSVIVFDAGFNTLPNQSVTLSADAGSHAAISVVDGTSTGANGAARFTLTDTVAEAVTLTAKIGGNEVTNTAQVIFVGPPAASGGMVASPTAQTADGTSTSTITVSLQDAQGHPTPGKQVRLAQDGSSVILGANPGMTDINGEAQFDVTDQVEETAAYSGVDVSDGDLPIPQTASVNFSSAASNACGVGATPVAGPGYALSVYASGFPVQSNVTFGGITLNGCAGVSGIAFDDAQNLFASDYVTGDVYEFPSG
ncbi:MAG: protease pro-enzyme activation domain-containing protein, partial [Rudaea sp.]